VGRFGVGVGFGAWEGHWAGIAHLFFLSNPTKLREIISHRARRPFDDDRHGRRDRRPPQGRAGPFPGTDPRTRLVQRLVLGACVALFAGLGLYEAWADGPTFDEPVYVAPGCRRFYTKTSP